MYLKMVNAMAKNTKGTAYLRFDGASYFNLGIIPTGNFEMEITARALSNNIINFIAFGQQAAWNNSANRLCVGFAANGCVWFANQSAYDNSRYFMSNYINSIHTYYVSKTYMGIDGERYALGTFSLGQYDTPIWLGTLLENLSASGWSVMDFFELKCWRGGVLVADFIPLADNKILNVVTEDVILNSGLGTARIRYE